jgi:probable F420-dependent oxidoreductase
MFRVWLQLDMNLPLEAIGAQARRAESLGCDVVTLPDVACDALLAAQAAILATERVQVATSGLIAFARSPMITAIAAWNLAALSGGRFRLGLSSLVAPMIARKYGMEWQPPAPRMREYIGALRAIHASWQSDVPLRFEGKYYRLTKQNTWTRPAPIPHPDIAVHLGAIGPKMCAVAGECASGLLTHPTNSAPRYLREVMRVEAQRGARSAGRSMKDFELVVTPPCATGVTQAQIEALREKHREMLGTNLSTPSYWRTFDLYGWTKTGERLRELVREGRWDLLASQITEEMLEVLVPTAPYHRLGRVLRDRFEGICEGICLALPIDDADDDHLARLIRELRE